MARSNILVNWIGQGRHAMVGLVVGDDAQGGAQGGPDTQGQGRE